MSTGPLEASTSVMGETTNNPTLGALSSESKAQPGEKTTTTAASEHASSSSLGPEPPQGGRDIPLGLGSGGLQPKVINYTFLFFRAYEICTILTSFLTGYRVCSAPISVCGSLIL